MSTSYTYEALAAAAAVSTSISEVVRRLGGKQVGGTQAHVGRQLRKFEIDISHFKYFNPDRPAAAFSRDAIIAAADGAASIAEVVRRLGGAPGTAQYSHVSRELKAAGINVARGAQLGRRLFAALTDQEIIDAVAGSKSIAECARLLGKTDGGAFRVGLRAKIAELALDTDHWLGQAHNRGKQLPRTPAAEILVHRPDKTNRTPAHLLRRAMIETGTPHRCAGCALGTSWHGLPITLQIDHINGDYTDNRAGNLRFLCPNCHAVTSTYGRKRSRS